MVGIRNGVRRISGLFVPATTFLRLSGLLNAYDSMYSAEGKTEIFFFIIITLCILEREKYEPQATR